MALIQRWAHQTADVFGFICPVASIVASYLLGCGSQAIGGKPAKQACIPVKLKCGHRNVNFVSFSQLLKDSAFYFPPFKQVKAIFSSGCRKSGDGADLAHRPSLGGLGSYLAGEQAVSGRALTLSETKSKVLKWEVWTDTWVQKTSLPFEKVLTKPENRNINSFRPLQQP